MLFSGLIIWCFSWLVCLAFGFYLIDAVVRLGVVGGLMPFLIAAWPFKLTSQYTSTGWKMFMNTFFTFVFLGLVVSVNIELGLQAVTGGEGGYDKIMELVNANEVKPLVDIMSIGLMGLLFLILCCIFGFKLCGEAVSLASQMSGGQGGTIGSHIASLGAGAAKWGAVNTGKAVGKTAKSVGEASGVNDKIRQGKEVVGRKMYNGMAAVGRRLGLKGAAEAAATDRVETAAEMQRHRTAATLRLKMVPDRELRERPQIRRMRQPNKPGEKAEPQQPEPRPTTPSRTIKTAGRRDKAAATVLPAAMKTGTDQAPLPV